MTDYDAIRIRYTAEFCLYQELADTVADLLKRDLHSRGVDFIIQHRAKSIPSLMKKAMRTKEPYERLFDKAGVRIIVPYKEWISLAEEAVNSVIHVTHRDDTLTRYSSREFDYLGLHFGGSLRDEALTSDRQEIAELVCEVQVQTGAEYLWMSVSHDLTYKPDVGLPPELLRGMHRLMALMEIFDNEVSRIRQGLLKDPGFIEYRLLDTLEKYYYQFDGPTYDRKLSYQTLHVVLPLLETSEVEEFPALMDHFIAEHRGKIVQLYSEHREDPRSELLFQPEALLIFERLSAHKSLLTEAWQKYLPISLLEQLSEIWGDPIITDYS